MSAVVMGGAIAQWPLGAFSDRMDRRFVMLVARPSRWARRSR